MADFNFLFRKGSGISSKQEVISSDYSRDNLFPSTPD
jgi:hypothetical protein